MDENTRIMAVETSSRMGSVAVAQGPVMLAERLFTDLLRHAGQLLPMMALLTKQQGWKPADIDQLYISNGPGSFTGLRIAVTAAKSFTIAQPHTRIVAVGSTDVLVQNALQAAAENHLDNLQNVAVVIDAKRKQIYTALYALAKSPAVEELGENQDWAPDFRTIMPAQVCPPEKLLEISPRPLFLLGPGLKSYQEKLRGDGIHWLDEKYSQPRAANVFRSGYLLARAQKFISPDELVPFYLRRPEAVERWERDYGEKSITEL
jgi:tRNA threonylcarbamoyladenosine biosynthesis protein TsaB